VLLLSSQLGLTSLPQGTLVTIGVHVKMAIIPPLIIQAGMPPHSPPRVQYSWMLIPIAVHAGL
jgi:hypothetical protein